MHAHDLCNIPNALHCPLKFSHTLPMDCQRALQMLQGWQRYCSKLQHTKQPTRPIYITTSLATVSPYQSPAWAGCLPPVVASITTVYCCNAPLPTSDESMQAAQSENHHDLLRCKKRHVYGTLYRYLGSQLAQQHAVPLLKLVTSFWDATTCNTAFTSLDHNYASGTVKA